MPDLTDDARARLGAWAALLGSTRPRNIVAHRIERDQARELATDLRALLSALSTAEAELADVTDLVRNAYYDGACAALTNMNPETELETIMQAARAYVRASLESSRGSGLTLHPQQHREAK